MNTLVLKVYLGKKQVGVIIQNENGYFYRPAKTYKAKHNPFKDGEVFEYLNRCMFSVAGGSSDVKFIDVEDK